MTKKLLYTGASGFLGSNTIPILQKMYNITTVGLTDMDNYQVNFADDIPVFVDTYDTVLHAAGKAHVIPNNKAEEQSFYDINLQGTKNLCTALENVGVPKNFIFISTVAVYGCDIGHEITEEQPLSGSTAYAQSKVLAEKFLSSWCKTHNVCLSILRPSLIAGPNAPGNLGAMVRGLKTGKYLNIKGNEARKSVLMVHDIANLVPLLEDKGGIYNVCDSYHPSFGELEELICSQLNKRLPVSIPMWLAKLMAGVGDLFGSSAPINSEKMNKLISSLTFSNEKARRELGWKPINVINNYKIIL